MEVEDVSRFFSELFVEETKRVPAFLYKDFRKKLVRPHFIQILYRKMRTTPLASFYREFKYEIVLQMNRSDEGKFKHKRSDIILCLFFIVFWIIPLFATNLARKKISFIPQFIATIYSTSNLFTQANFIWPMPYIQVLPAGSSAWVTLPEQDYFHMETFGHRTRLFEALYLGEGDEQKSFGVQKEIARWIAQKYQEKHDVRVSSVRFVAGLHRADPKASFKGRWKKPSYDSFAIGDTYELSRHDMNPLDLK